MAAENNSIFFFYFSRMDSIINEAYPHISELIFGFLPPNDFLKCLRVCKTWKASIEENMKLWQIIGWKVIHTGYYDTKERKKEDFCNLKHEQQWEIFKKALNSKDKEVVRKTTKMLIWFDEWYYRNRKRKYLSFKHPPLKWCTYFSLDYPERLDFFLSISGNEIWFRRNPCFVLEEAERRNQLESVKVISKYKNKLDNQGISYFDYVFRCAAMHNKLAWLNPLLPHVSENGIKTALSWSCWNPKLEQSEL